MPYPYYLPMAPRQTGTIHHVPMQGLVTPFGGVTALPGSPPPIGSLAGPGLLALMNAARPILIFPPAVKGGGGGGGGAKKAAATTTPPPADKPAGNTPPPAASVGTAEQKPYVYYNPLDGYLYTADPFTDEKNARLIMPFYKAHRTKDDRVFDPTPGSGNGARNFKFLGYIKEADYNAAATPGWKPSNVHPLSEYPNGFNPINQQPGVPAQKAGPASPPSLNPAAPNTNPNKWSYFWQGKPPDPDSEEARKARETQMMYASNSGLWDKDPIMGATRYHYGAVPDSQLSQTQALNQRGAWLPKVDRPNRIRDLIESYSGLNF